jgi:hypothetical protein
MRAKAGASSRAGSNPGRCEQARRFSSPLAAMTSEDTPRPLSWSPLLSSLGFEIPPVFVTSRTSNPRGCTHRRRPYGDGTRRPASLAASAACVPGPRAQLLRTSLLRGMAVRGRPATRPHRRTGSLPYVRDPGGRYLSPRSAAGRDRSTTPNLDSRRLKCHSAGGVDGAAARPGHAVHKCTDSGGALEQLLDGPRTLRSPRAPVGESSLQTRALLPLHGLLPPPAMSPGLER